MPNVVDVRIKALERQIDILKNAVAQPAGLFETIDAMIKTFRMANRETLQAIGIPLSGQIRGFTPNIGLLTKFGLPRRKIREFRLPIYGPIQVLRKNILGR